LATGELDVAELLRGRCKFYPVGDPHRILLVKAYEAIEELWSENLRAYSPHTAESVEEWLSGEGVKLTPKQRKTLDLGE
jgi:hypothetical protein